MAEIIWGSLSMEDIPLSESEISQRLKIPPDYTNVVIDKCTLAVEQASAPRYCYIKTGVSIKGEDAVFFDFGKVKSGSLCKNLKGCKYAYIMALTLGIEVDRLITRLSAVSKAEAFVADGIASAYSEAVADYVNNIIADGLSLRPRYSPGYGDLDISLQRSILEYLKADKFAGIKLSDNYLMIPRKSITAICGID